MKENNKYRILWVAIGLLLVLNIGLLVWVTFFSNGSPSQPKRLFLEKELKFDKSVDELIYQATKDKDIIGRQWAMTELSKVSATDTAKILTAFIQLQMSIASEPTPTPTSGAAPLSDQIWFRVQATSSTQNTPGHKVVLPVDSHEKCRSLIFIICSRPILK